MLLARHLPHTLTPLASPPCPVFGSVVGLDFRLGTTRILILISLLSYSSMFCATSTTT